MPSTSRTPGQSSAPTLALANDLRMAVGRLTRELRPQDPPSLTITHYAALASTLRDSKFVHEEAGPPSTTARAPPHHATHLRTARARRRRRRRRREMAWHPYTRRHDEPNRPLVRVVSLVPSITETLSAWDRTPVACTRFCERPDLAHVGGTKNPDIDAIVALEPDLVVLDAEENRREDHDELVARGVTTHVTRVRDLADLDPAMRELAGLVGATWTPPALGEPRPITRRAFVPIWRRPWMALGAPTYATSLLAHLGVANVLANEGPYPAVTLEEVAALAPDLVLAPSEPYPFGERHRRELEAVGPVHLLDGRDLFWWGSRTAGALARLEELIATITRTPTP